MNITVAKIDRQKYPEADKFYASVGYNNPISPTDTVIVAQANNEIIGVVRIAYENGFEVLRGMQVAQSFQRKGIGHKMLLELAKHIKFDTCYCLPHGWLDSFYGLIGFIKIADAEAPPHLQERLKGHRAKYPQMIAMKRALK